MVKKVGPKQTGTRSSSGGGSPISKANQKKIFIGIGVIVLAAIAWQVFN